VDPRPSRPVRSVVLDVGIAVAVLLAPVTLWLSGAQEVGPWNAAGVVVSCAALAWRRTRTTAALVVTGVLAVAETASLQVGALQLPLAIVVYTVVASGRRRFGLAVAAASAVVLDGVLLLRGEAPTSAVVVAVPLLFAVAAVVGLAVAARRAELATARDRADRAEATREAESRRAVAEERVRIARELHDVLAHQVAVVGVQSGVAEALLLDDPPAARDALVLARTASQDALRELATLLDLLRRGDDDHRAAPAPSMARLDDLLTAARGTGLDVDVEVVGERRALAPVVDLAAYRVLQEALTNAHKHGAGRARVALTWRPDAVEVVVTNPVPRPADGTGEPAATAASTGYGLIGMAERVSAVGGTLDVGRTPDGHRVRALLPAPATTTQEAP
jgi:signal transduction histidine kinase